MSDDNDDSTTTTTEKTFTRAEVRKMIAAEVSKVNERYADYDDLKKAAEAAGKDKSALEKLSEQVGQLTSRAEKAELDVARREIADEFGLTSREARRLRGKNIDDFRQDAEELVEDLGIDVKARKAGKATATTEPKGDATDDGDGGDGNAAATDDASRDAGETRRQTRQTRSRETLTSGAPRTPTPSEETNPLKLVADIPRR